jgi:uncharacterized protein YxjI
MIGVMDLNNLYDLKKYLIRRKVLTFAGAKFHVFDPNGQVIMFSKMKAFKLKEDIRLYTGEDMQNELITIHARQIIDFSAAYDVFDANTGEKIGALQRKGLKSILRDEWLILDANDNQIGSIKEDNTGLAIVRRFLTNLIPQSFDVEINGQVVAVFKQRFNPYIMKLDLDFSPDTGNILDRRLGLAAGILLCAIEGRQS